MWIYLKNNWVLFILKMSGSRGSLCRPNDGMQGCTNPGRQVGPATDFSTVATNIIVGTQYGTYFTRQFWWLEFGGSSHIFGKILDPWWEEW